MERGEEAPEGDPAPAPRACCEEGRIGCSSSLFFGVDGEDVEADFVTLRVLGCDCFFGARLVVLMVLFFFFFCSLLT